MVKPRIQDHMLAVIPARAGSKGIPGKNVRPLAGLPLIAHSILLSKMCPIITRTVVSTDAPEIAQVAREFGAEVPFMRPEQLAQDHTPMWSVVRHALEMVDPEGSEYRFLLLLDPTSPGRLPEDVCCAYERLSSTEQAEGIIGVSEPGFNPIWHCVVERDGWMDNLFTEATQFHRRQDLPTVYRINASLYIWRTSFVRQEESNWRKGKHLIYAIPEARGIHIDEWYQFEAADLMVRNGLIQLPWLNHM